MDNKEIKSTLLLYAQAAKITMVAGLETTNCLLIWDLMRFYIS